jgi:DNA-binding transcriptional regulator YiaG
MKTDSKYYALFDYLRHSDGTEVTLSFSKIEALIESKLPPSARSTRAFWSNRAQGGLQAAAWLKAGYRVVKFDLQKGKIKFRRLKMRYSARPANTTPRWDGEMVRSLRSHLNMSQVELAEILGVRQQTISEWETSAYMPTRSRSKHLTMVAEQAGIYIAKGDSRNLK